MTDPRPLPGEPLALDLLNTEYMSDDGPRDLLADPRDARAWAKAAGVPFADEALEPLRTARAAIRHAVKTGDGEPLNAVLAHGRLVERLGPKGPEQTLELDAPAHEAAWRAAHNLLELLRDRPERIRACAGHGCVLYFYDTSRAGRRQWCSMAGCGNRAKAQRHYARTRPART
jgi:predicted RNA-binding Zn ribbon-like protein